MIYRLFLIFSALSCPQAVASSTSTSSADFSIEELDQALEKSHKKRVMQQLSDAVGNGTFFDLHYRLSVEELRAAEIETLIKDIRLKDSLSNTSIAGKIFIDATKRIEQHTEFIGMQTTMVTLHSKDEDVTTRMKFIPFNLTRFKNLQRLALSHNAIFIIPRFIANFHVLKVLDLSQNRLMHVSPVLGELDCLEELNLSGNQLLDVDPEIGMLSTLKILNLSENVIQKLPPVIGNLESLISLNVMGNKLKDLPQTMQKLRKLKALSLSRNLFETFPHFLSDLSNLRILILSFNASRTIPETLTSLIWLEQLYLSHHQMGGNTKEITDRLNALKAQKQSPPVNVYLDIPQLSEK